MYVFGYASGIALEIAKTSQQPLDGLLYILVQTFMVPR